MSDFTLGFICGMFFAVLLMYLNPVASRLMSKYWP